MFNKKLNQKIDLLMDRVDSLTAKITEIDAKLLELSCGVSNFEDSVSKTSENVSSLNSTLKSLKEEVDEWGRYTIQSTIDTDDIVELIEFLIQKLHDSKVIDATDNKRGFHYDDDCPLEQAEQNLQESPKQEQVGDEKPKMEVEGGEAIIEQPKLQDNEVDADLIKQVAKETKQRMVVRKKDREFFRMAFYRKLPHRFHLLSAVGIGANMGLSRYNVEKLLSDDIATMYYEEKSPKIYVMIKQLPQD